MKRLILAMVVVAWGSSVFAAEQKAPKALVLDEQDIVLTLPTGEDGTQIDVMMPGHLFPATDMKLPESPKSFGRPGAMNQARPIFQQYPAEVDILNAAPRIADMNGLSGYFSSATGGVGVRFGYDRRLSPNLRFMAGTEMMTFGFRKSFSKLGADMPNGVERISLMGFPVGLQRQFRAKHRVIPHIGFGVGPYIRFDHQSPVRAGYSYPGGLGLNAGSGAFNGYSVNAGIPFEDFPTLSLTVGGFTALGFDYRLGEERTIALTVDGRYTMARFFDALGNPGDLGGFSLAVGVGKYF
jgi:hypothetical protein